MGEFRIVSDVKRTVPALVCVGLFLSACTDTTPPRPAMSSPAAPTASAGTVGNPQVRSCADGGVQNQNATSPQDIVAGPLRYPNARLLARPGSEAEFYGGGVGVSPSGLRFYKMGTYVAAGTTVTVSVLPPATDFARLQGEGLDRPGDQSVTFRACPAGAATSWVGGFDLLNRSAACLPLEVRVTGESQPRRIVISLFNGGCAVP
jgi:hypothetical protein